MCPFPGGTVNEGIGSGGNNVVIESGLNVNGYWEKTYFNDELVKVIQTNPGLASTSWTFPIEFPTADITVSWGGNFVDWAYAARFPRKASMTTTSMSVQNRRTDNGSIATIETKITAIWVKGT